MSDKDQQPGKSGFSLQDEIKKRKTQEMQRAIEQKKIDIARGESPASKDPRRTSQTASAAQPSTSDPRRTSQTTPGAQPAADPLRTSQTMQPAQPNADPRRSTQSASAVPDPRRSTQTAPTLDPRRATQTTRPAADPRRATQAYQPVATTTNRSRRALMIGAGAGLLAIMVLMGTFFLATGANNVTPTTQPTATSVTLPIVSANDIVAYLQKVGVPISSLRQLPVDHAIWSANQEIQFDVQRGSDKGTFIVLSYPSRNPAVGDSFHVQNNTNLKNWQVTNISNVLILTSPDAPQDIAVEMSSHLTSYLLAPYRPFLPSATPPPTATAAGTEQATP